LNQKLSEKQKAKDPTEALPKKVNRSALFSNDLNAGNFLISKVSVQKRNSTCKSTGKNGHVIDH
jgi:hypothetical protein